MLVLTRRLNQTITLGDPAGIDPPIEVTIIEVRGDQVRLGISAPRGVSVDRKEVWIQKQACTSGRDTEVSRGLAETPKP